MKQVTIIYRNRSNQSAVNFIKQNLEEIFSSHILFTNCFLCDIKPGEKLISDAFLALNGEIFSIVKENNYIDDFGKIIKMNRSPAKTALKEISRIPAGTKVLIVNDSYESSVETAQSFYEAGVGHINMIPYDETLVRTGIYNDIDTAITPAEPHLVPSFIKNTTDIGYRKVSFDTMFKLMKLLDLDISTINRNLFRHIHSIVESDTAFHDNYVFSYLKSEMLSHIVNSSKTGVILTDSSYELVYINDTARQALHCTACSTIRLSDFINADLLASPDAFSKRILLPGGNYYYDKYTITLMDEVAGYYITLQNETEIDTRNKSYQKKGFSAKHQFEDIIHASKDMDKAIEAARKIAHTDYTVLIRGESGTGKELFAQSIHNASHRNKRPFVAVNCAALPDNLLESELFGYEPGAFTGAQSGGKIGLFEEANHGTIFLDEIGDISPKLQSKLLRAIQERQIMKVGSDRLIDIDIRLITATNRNLEEAVSEGTFRSDLFYRLNVLPIVIPPLRRRKEDIPLLLQYFLGNVYKDLLPQELHTLLNYDWPGNVRELENFSTYYKTLSDLPEYIVQTGIDNTHGDRKEQLNTIILSCINENTGISSGIGRAALLQLLLKKGIRISDGKLRTVLCRLEEEHLIHIGKGRCGMQITEEGLSLLKTSSTI